MSNMPAHTTAAGANTTFTGRDPWIALSRAEANVVRLRKRLSRDPLLPTGNRLSDALAAIARDADHCRARAWSYLATLRRHVCTGAEPTGSEFDRHMLREQLQTLRLLAIRRRRALCDNGAAEAVYRWHTNRSRVAARRSDDLSQLSKFREDEFWVEPSTAANALLVMEAALLRARSDAWWYILKLHDALAAGERFDTDTVIDLRACRAEIVGLNAMLAAAKATTLAEHEAVPAAEDLDARPSNVVSLADRRLTASFPAVRTLHSEGCLPNSSSTTSEADPTAVP
jgi:hypothetical protein